MAPGASIVVLCADPVQSPKLRRRFFDEVPAGMATLAGLPGVSVVSVSYGLPVSASDALDNSVTARSCSRPSLPIPT